MDVRKMGPEDAPALARAEAQCFGDPWSEGMFREELQNPLTEFWGIEAPNGELAAYAGWQCVAGEGSLLNIGVIPEYRRRGLAKRLLDHVRLEALNAGAEFLTLEVRESNAPARALYAAFGFVEVGRRPGYYEAPTEDAVLMTLEFQ